MDNSFLGMVLVLNVIIWGIGLIFYTDFEEFKKLGLTVSILITLLAIGCYLTTGGK